MDNNSSIGGINPNVLASHEKFAQVAQESREGAQTFVKDSRTAALATEIESSKTATDFILDLFGLKNPSERLHAGFLSAFSPPQKLGIPIGKLFQNLGNLQEQAERINRIKMAAPQTLPPEEQKSRQSYIQLERWNSFIETFAKEQKKVSNLFEFLRTKSALQQETDIKIASIQKG